MTQCLGTVCPGHRDGTDRSDGTGTVLAPGGHGATLAVVNSNRAWKGGVALVAVVAAVPASAVVGTMDGIPLRVAPSPQVAQAWRVERPGVLVIAPVTLPGPRRGVGTSVVIGSRALGNEEPATGGDGSIFAADPAAVLGSLPAIVPNAPAAAPAAP